MLTVATFSVDDAGCLAGGRYSREVCVFYVFRHCFFCR